MIYSEEFSAELLIGGIYIYTPFLHNLSDKGFERSFFFNRNLLECETFPGGKGGRWTKKL